MALKGIEKVVAKFCVETAVYWGNPQPDGYGGVVYDSPVEISVRWEDKTRIVTDKDGKEMLSLAEVLVTEDLDAGGMLTLGGLSDLTSEGEPATGSRHEILSISKIPMIKSTTDFVRTVYLGSARYE